MLHSIIMTKDIRLLVAAHIFYIIIVELVVMNLDMLIYEQDEHTIHKV